MDRMDQTNTEERQMIIGLFSYESKEDLFVCYRYLLKLFEDNNLPTTPQQNPALKLLWYIEATLLEEGIFASEIIEKEKLQHGSSKDKSNK